MAKAGSLYTSLTLESSQFVVGLKKSVDQAAKSGVAIEQHLNRARTAATAFVGFIAGSQLVAATKRGLDYASSLGEISQQLGVTTRDLQLYRYIATQVGVDQGEMDKSLAKLTRTIGEAAAGSKAQVATFRELDVAIKDASGRTRTAGELMPKLADALSKIKDPAARARIEVDLFGKSGQRLDPLLSGGSAAINEMTRAFEEFGMEISPELIARADDAADKMSKLKTVLETKLAIGAAENADMIAALSDQLAWLAQKSGEAFRNFSNLRNLRGLNLAGSPEAAKNLLTSQSGRQALAVDIDNKIQANMKARASGTGNAAVLDAQFKDLMRMRNGVIRAGRAASRMDSIRKPGTEQSDGPLPTSTATGGRKSSGPSGPTAAETEAQYRSQLRSIVGQTLSANASMASSAQERAEIASRQLNDDLRDQREEIDNNKHYTKAQRDRLKDELKFLEQDERRRIDAELNDQLIEEEVDAKRQALQFEIQSLSLREAIAKTEMDRRALQLQILDKETEMDRLAADGVLRKTLTNDAEKALAQAKLNNLASEKAGATNAIIDRTMGPMERYLSEVPRTADQINEKFEQIAVNGLQNMNDQLANAAANTLKLKGFAGQLFNQLIADVIRLNLQQATGGGGLLGGLVKIGTSIFGGGLGGVSASSMSAIDSQVAAIQTRNLAGFANGGSFRIRGRPGIDRNVMSINGNRVARVGDGEIVNIQRAGNDNPGGIATIIPSPYFNVVVDQRAAGVAAPMSAQAASGGSIGAQKAIARSNSRSLA